MFRGRGGLQGGAEGGVGTVKVVCSGSEQWRSSVRDCGDKVQYSRWGIIAGVSCSHTACVSAFFNATLIKERKVVGGCKVETLR